MNLYLPDLDATFIHVPKTGGTWVNAVLRASGLTCLPVGPGSHNPLYSTPADRKFMFVRRPTSWYESIFKGLHQSWPDHRPVAPLHQERTWSPIRMLTYTVGEADFDDFCVKIMAKQSAFCSRMFEWYAGPPGLPLVGYVGRCEHIAEDLAQILFHLGWKGELPQMLPVNQSEGQVRWDSALYEEFDLLEFGKDRWYSSDGPFVLTK